MIYGRRGNGMRFEIARDHAVMLAWRSPQPDPPAAQPLGQIVEPESMASVPTPPKTTRWGRMQAWLEHWSRS